MKTSLYTLSRSERTKIDKHENSSIKLSNLKNRKQSEVKGATEAVDQQVKQHTYNGKFQEMLQSIKKKIFFEEILAVNAPSSIKDIKPQSHNA